MLVALLLVPAMVCAQPMRWPEAVAVLAAERTRAETCVRLLKRHAGDNTAALSHGELAYTEAKAEVDAVIAGLMVVLAERGTPPDLAELETRLIRGVQAREAFCTQVSTLVPPDPGTRSLLLQLVGVFLPPLRQAVHTLYTGKAEQDQLLRTAIRRRTGTAVAPGARLHVLTVGVSEYGQKAAHLRLTFAATDATAVAAALLNTQDSLYAEVRPQRLTDQDATRAGILRGLATMREAMARGEPGRDLAVVHFSGHGTLLDDEFYLLPHDVDASDTVALKATALPASDLRRELAGLADYGRVLVLVDACRSGGAMATGQALAVDATRLRTALVGPNITVLTSSSAAQLSRENPTWGHGAFTTILLEALSGRADADRNGLISVSELTGYLTRHVPGLTAGAGYPVQTPGVEVRFDGDVFAAGL